MRLIRTPLLHFLEAGSHIIQSLGIHGLLEQPLESLGAWADAGRQPKRHTAEVGLGTVVRTLKERSGRS